MIYKKYILKYNNTNNIHLNKLIINIQKVHIQFKPLYNKTLYI